MNKDKPIRDYKKTLLTMVEKSIGTSMFQTYWATVDGQTIDLPNNGDLSCAFYVSGLLAILGKMERANCTVSSTIVDMEKCGWRKVNSPEVGDIIHWNPKDTFKEGVHPHIGFYMGADMCVSNSSEKRSPQRHVLNWDDRRYVEAMYRLDDWQSEPVQLRVA